MTRLLITTGASRFAEAGTLHDVVVTPAMLHGQSGIRNNG